MQIVIISSDMIGAISVIMIKFCIDHVKHVKI